MPHDRKVQILGTMNAKLGVAHYRIRLKHADDFNELVDSQMQSTAEVSETIENRTSDLFESIHSRSTDFCFLEIGGTR